MRNMDSAAAIAVSSSASPSCRAERRAGRCGRHLLGARPQRVVQVPGQRLGGVRRRVQQRLKALPRSCMLRVPLARPPAPQPGGRPGAGAPRPARRRSRASARSAVAPPPASGTGLPGPPPPPHRVLWPAIMRQHAAAQCRTLMCRCSSVQASSMPPVTRGASALTRRRSGGGVMWRRRRPAHRPHSVCPAAPACRTQARPAPRPRAGPAAPRPRPAAVGGAPMAQARASMTARRERSCRHWSMRAPSCSSRASTRRR